MIKIDQSSRSAPAPRRAMHRGAVVELGRQPRDSIAPKAWRPPSSLPFESKAGDEVQGFLVGEPMAVGQFERSFAAFNGRPRPMVQPPSRDDRRLAVVTNAGAEPDEVLAAIR
ncbi:MAG: hypothetical protein R3F54_24880 [Alphaproteobacteria bacterium]